MTEELATFLLLLPVIMIDPGLWLFLARLLEKEDRANSDLRTWELTGL